MVLNRPHPPAAHESLAWGAVLLAARAPLIAGTEQDPDGSRFVRAVERFDLASGAPHPPGYPVYVAAGKAVRAAGLADEPAVALGAVSALAFAGLAVAAFRVADAAAGRAAARVAMFLLLGSPVLVLFGGRAMSDLPGTALAWGVLATGVAAVARREGTPRATEAALAAAGTALLAGVRPSALPFALPALWGALRASGRPGIAVVAGAVALAAWGVPFGAVVDPAEALSRTAAHAGGHFEKWGGSLFTVRDPFVRVGGLMRALWRDGLGGPLPAAGASALAVGAGLAVLLIPVKAAPGEGAPTGPTEGADGAARARRLLWTCSLAYLAWIAVAQNVAAQPRHVLPLVPALAVGLAALGVDRWCRWRSGPVRAGRAVLLAAALAASWQAAHLATVQARNRPTAVRIAARIAARPDAGAVVVAARDLADWIGHRAPGVAVRRVPDVAAACALPEARTHRLLVLGDVPGARALPPEAAVHRAVHDAAVDPSWPRLTLYDLSGPGPAESPPVPRNDRCSTLLSSR